MNETHKRIKMLINYIIWTRVIMEEQSHPQEISQLRIPRNQWPNPREHKSSDHVQWMRSFVFLNYSKLRIWKPPQKLILLKQNILFSTTRKQKLKHPQRIWKPSMTKAVENESTS